MNKIMTAMVLALTLVATVSFGDPPEQGVKKAAIRTAEDKEALRGRNQCGALELRWE